MKDRNDTFRLRCRTCSQGFFEMLDLLKHRDRCHGDARNPARNDERRDNGGSVAPSAVRPSLHRRKR